MSAHLAALQVVLPLLAAPLCVLLRRQGAAWLLYLLAALGSFGCALGLLDAVRDHGRLHYAMGGWPAPFGIEYVIDGANIYMLLLVSFIGVVAGVYGRRSIAAEIEPRRIYLYYACLSLCLAGLLGIAATGDAFNVFVFLEISSLSSYALIAMGRRRRALLAALQYLIMGTIGGTFVLIGIGLLYALTGTLNMIDLAERVPALYGNRALTAAAAFIGLGLGIKMALLPLHAWLPNAYAEAPSAASLFLAATGTKVALYAFLRFSFDVFGTELLFGLLNLDTLLLAMAAAAMLTGALIACFQHDFKRLLAWSSVGQIGYIVAGLALATPAGLSASFLHLFNHALTKAALFGVAGLLLLRLSSTDINDYAGLARRMPGAFAALLICGLGLVGIPLTAGFVSKWALAQALIGAGLWWMVAAMLLSSLFALIYVGRIIEIAWFRAPPETAVAAVPAGSMQLATWTLVLATLWLGVDSSGLARLAEAAAAALLSVPQ